MTNSIGSIGGWRTSALAFIEQNARSDGPYEVTQLINSFLGALAHPWKSCKAHLVRLMRNGFAHGHIEFLEKIQKCGIGPS